MSAAQQDTGAVTVVVVARNEAGMIGACMAALAAQSHAPAEVILVDDGSTDATVAEARAALPGVRVIDSPTRAISQNRNVGWRAATTDFVAYLDADCAAPEGWLAGLVAAITAAGPEVAAVGGGNTPPRDAGDHYAALGIMLESYLGSRGSIQGQVPRVAKEVPHLPTLNVLYRVSALKLAGGFDTRFARMGEDEDLSRRLGDMGFVLRAVPGVDVIHRQRADLRGWARNMFGYGKGRTWLLRRHPNGVSPLFLVPPLALLGLPVYLVLIALYALWLCAGDGRIRLWPAVTARFWATHIPYALGQIVGLVQANDTGAPRARRLGLVALKNAGNKGDEAIVWAVSRRVLPRLAADQDLYLLAFGPSGLDVRVLPLDDAARGRVILSALAPAETAAGARAVRPLTLLLDGVRALIVFAGFRAIFISGGQWLHDLSRAKHIAVTGLFAFGRLFGTRTGVFCIGAGPLDKPGSNWLVRRGFGAGALMVTRDDASTALLKKAGRAQTITASDPALLLETAPAPDPEAAEPGQRVLISPCAWASFENIYTQDKAAIEASFQGWLRLVEGVAARGYRLAMLPTMNPEDEAFAARIIAAAPDAGIGMIDTGPLTPAEVQGHIAGAKALISMRLHPVIFASNCGTPFVALNYADKVRAFCEKAGFGDRLVEPRAAGWPEEVLARLDGLLAEGPGAPDDPARAARTAQLDGLDRAYETLFEWLGAPPAPAAPLS